MHELLTIDELAERSGLSIRTIRFYISEGLLPSSQVRGRNAAYSSEALDRLILIQRLKDAHLPLQEIRAQLDALSPERIHQLAQEQDQGPGVRFATLMSDYSKEESDSALNYITRILDARSAYHAAEPMRSSAQLAPPASPELRKAEPAESWRRIEIMPGIELHLREPIDPLIQKKLAHIIDTVKILFRKTGQ